MNKVFLKNLLMSLKEEDYPATADFHIHSNESDGFSSPYEIAARAEKEGKKYISIADHNTIEAYYSTNILSKDFVIPSVEFDCFYRFNIIHILGFGIDIDNKEIQKLFAKSEAGRKCKICRVFMLRNPKDVVNKIKAAGGIPVLAHPARYCCLNLEAFVKPLVKAGLEGLEVYYLYRGIKNLAGKNSNKKVEELADKYNLLKTGGTDTH